MANRLWTRAPRENLRSFAGKFSGLGWWKFDVSRLLADPKHMNACALVDRWERYLRIVNSAEPGGPWAAIDFKGKTVIELGCGPLLGFGPIFLFLGARQFAFDDPFFNREVVDSRRVRRGYFEPMFRELTANYGNRMTLETFIAKLDDACVNATGIPPGSADFLVSNSTLEHLPLNEIDGIFAGLGRHMKPGAPFLHAVDFGPHGVLPGLAEMYRRDRKLGVREINSLRCPELVARLNSAGFLCATPVVYRQTPVRKQDVDVSWRGFSDEDLSTRVAILQGRFR